MLFNMYLKQTQSFNSALNALTASRLMGVCRVCVIAAVRSITTGRLPVTGTEHPRL